MPATGDSTARSDSGLARSLAELEQPQAHLLPPPVPLRWPRSLYHHPLTHRVVPDRLGVALAAVAGRAEWGLAAARRRAALERAALLLGGRADATRLASFARRSMADVAIRREIEWRPWTARSLRLEGLAHLEGVQASGRGALLASLHLGPFMSLPLALAHRGWRPYVSGGAQQHESPRDASTIKLNVDFERAGGRWVRLGGTFPLLCALLERGEVCHLMLDTETGREPARLVGRPVRLAGGVARLALATGAPIVPAYAAHTRGRPFAALLAPVEVEPGDDEASLTSRVAQRLDPAVTAHLTQWRPPLSVLAPAAD